MEKESIVLTKSFDFAVRILKLNRYLIQRKEFQIANQVVRSGTSIGANLEEAAGAHTRKEFIQKNSIAYKEARETRYWLRVMLRAELIEPKLCSSLLNDCEELCRIIAAILKTSKLHLNATEV